MGVLPFPFSMLLERIRLPVARVVLPRLTAALFALALATPLPGQALGPRAVLSEISQNFGTVRRGARVEHSFKLGNPGTADLQISRMSLSMPGISVKAPRTVPAGQEVMILLSLNTAALTGDFQGTVTLFTNDPAAPKVALEISGRVESRVGLEPTSALFLSAFRWEAPEKESSVFVVNEDRAPLKILEVQTEGGSFTHRLAVIEEGQRYQLSIKVHPDAVAGKDEGRITLRTDQETIQIPVYTFLKDKVYANPTVLDFGRLDLDQVAADPGLLDYRKVSVFVYQHRGTDFQIRVDSLPDFLAVERTPAEGSGSVVEIPRQGQTAIFELAFSLVRERLRRGVFDDSIRLSTNDPDFPTIAIPLHLEVR